MTLSRTTNRTSRIIPVRRRTPRRSARVRPLRPHRPLLRLRKSSRPERLLRRLLCAARSGRCRVRVRRSKLVRANELRGLPA